MYTYLSANLSRGGSRKLTHTDITWKGPKNDARIGLYEWILYLNQQARRRSRRFAGIHAKTWDNSFARCRYTQRGKWLDTVGPIFLLLRVEIYSHCSESSTQITRDGKGYALWIPRQEKYGYWIQETRQKRWRESNRATFEESYMNVAFKNGLLGLIRATNSSKVERFDISDMRVERMMSNR